MKYIELTILSIIVLASVSYGIYYISNFFRTKNNPCKGCPYARACNQKESYEKI